MDEQVLWKLVHILSATILFGTGIGTAFFMLWAHCFGDIKARVFIARTTVIADSLFTLPTVIIQPFSGVMLANSMGHSLTDAWLLSTYFWYGIVILCWVIVYFLQIKIHTLLLASANNNTKLDEKYKYYYCAWFILGWPALFAFIYIFYAMVRHNLGY